MHTLESPINGADIQTITVRYKKAGGEAAIMKFFNEDGADFYVHLDGIPEQQIVKQEVDADGFTIVTFNFATFSMEPTDTWLPAERATKQLTQIGLCCNNASGAPTFDYVAYNVAQDGGSGEPEGPEGPEQTGIANTEFAEANTDANGYTLTDTPNGLQITGTAWAYAMHTLESPISGADIRTLTVRYKVTGGEGAIMKFYNEEGGFFYIHLNGMPEQQIVKQEVDADGFTIVTFNFATFSMDSGDTWLPADREAKKLAQIGLCCNNASGAPTFDYVAYNVAEEEEGTTLKFTKEMMNEDGGYQLSNTTDGLQITGAAWSYARHYLLSPISGADTTYLTVRYKVTGGEAAIMKFYNEEDEFFYVHLNGIPDGQKVSETVDGEGFTIVTINFQSFQMDAGDTWLPADRSTKNLTTIGLCCNNASGAPTFSEIKIK